ncbi:ABC-type antimicrobial peptide transport system ATPase component [Vibrio sp. RC586]|uniref:ABC transporter ATP-binding protein n=1 Tax=Vibrio sp. RC586 TaxID=675815 RepID=UPI0001BB8085|nr:ABC transporter ATP-binding protein [Vibrio sp. RC586]EEY97962.1 ABC-type antimicrobial peptide transport system ATPase component [Vibrio sp. RC586]
MIKLVKELLSVLNSKQRKDLFPLQVMVVLSAILEVLSVLSIGPFMAIVSNDEYIQSNRIISEIYKLSGVSSNIDFMFSLGVAVLVLMLIAAIASMITIWKLSMFAASVGSEFGDRLYEHYINMDYEYYTRINSADLVKKIATEVSRVTDNILQPLVQINARIATIVLISIFVFLYNPIVAIVGVTILGTAYFTLFSVVKNKLARNGSLISEYSKKRFSLMNEGFGSIKEVQVLGRQDYFIRQFKESGKIFSTSYGSSNSLYNIPRYFIELVVFSSMVAMILLLLKANNSNLATVLPVMGVFGVAAFKLLPSFQQIYSGAAQIRCNVSAFTALKTDLEAANTNKHPHTREENSEKLTGDIVVENISFSYKGKHKKVLNSISLEIPYKSSIGIVGFSGSGKSTLLDILIGCLSIENGTISVGGKKLNKSNNFTWKNSLGYVSQMALIRDGTVSENIAFGVEYNDINMEKLRTASKLAQLNDWINSLEKGFDTKVGDKGIQISGGQRQRIAIARALYNDAEYLFFDEATSALDGITEKQIMRSISDISGNKTIVMIAHRVNTIKNCDKIYVLNDGHITATGSYSDLIEKNEFFKKIAGVK